ncbi:intermembrane transport protein PqiB [Aeromonas sobria]|uniref:intermembrane transport protein PqiB n=1 Tax=Aeromonas sobria TaxID=646 RepID=UPI0011194C5A|nr:intermembrane transport protein PqiB [Aeromonas sobria]TNH93716.1 paraquat-inducible protein B [Aeromonas sobria]TNJ15405.1 paraquat-inducible protein B [Aeromonas sobria]HEH9439887.1 intermembrane transport protein PqiB [Aeromonas sobria]
MSERKKRWKPGSDFMSSAAAIWMVPLLALFIGLWMLFQHWYSQGPSFTLTVATAEGIVAGKTVIRSREVDVGRIEAVELSDDYSHAVLRGRLSNAASGMLRGDSQFWVVKPRVGREGVSGLGTLLSGAYIELSPGKKGRALDEYAMLDKPPLASLDAKGLRLTLNSRDTRALSEGSPINYQGFTIGQVEEAKFLPEKSEMQYQIFINAPYDILVSSNSRFWLTPGFEVSMSSEGMKVKMDSLESLLDGGITMGLPPGWSPGEPVTKMENFTLFQDEASVLAGSLDQFIDYVFLFDDNVGGLHPGAAVQYRGIRVGTVISAPYLIEDKGVQIFKSRQIPVLARIEVQRLSHRYAKAEKDQWRALFGKQFKEGLRASLKTSSLLTGGKIIDLNFYPDAPRFEQAKLAGYQVFPTVQGGLDQIERKVNAILDKFVDMDMATTLAKVNGSLTTLDGTLKNISAVSANLNKLTGKDATQQLPASLNESLKQLQETLQAYDAQSQTNQDLRQSVQTLNQLMRELQPLVHSLNEQPSSLIFDRAHSSDPEPKRGKQ